MAIKKVWIGSQGPFLYDDSADVLDPEGLITEKQSGIVVDGTIKILSAPVAPEDGLRLSDLATSFSAVAVTSIDDPSTELNALEGAVYGNLILCHQTAVGVDQCTLYVWDDTSNVAENVPYTVDGASGQWVAIAGKYSNIGYLYSLIRGMTATYIPFADSNGYLTQKNTLTFTTGTDTLNLTNLIVNTLATLATAKIGGATHYSEFESDGTLKFNGNATVFKDLICEANKLARLGAADPTYVKVTDNGAGSIGIYSPAFLDAAYKELQGEFEIQHDYKEGSDLVVHVHWHPSSTSTGNVDWEYEYVIHKSGSVIGNSTKSNITVSGPGVIKQAVRTNLVIISGTGIKVGDQIIVRFGRDARVTNGNDTFVGDVYIESLGIHYECDTVGSRQITTK